jgi:catechol 2,3-dioxygenase-like lactoylglutathione lyase family enzyme
VSLRDSELSASIAVADAEEATGFYEGMLGLSPLKVQADGSRVYGSAAGASLHVYPSPAHAGKATATLATWHVDDIERVVDELTARGVTFERYDDPELSTDEKGIARTPDGRVAWFKDPDGNTFAIEG